VRLKLEYLDGTSEVSVDMEAADWSEVKHLILNLTGQVINFHAEQGEILVPIYSVKRVYQV
jgi:hypothetical protein